MGAKGFLCIYSIGEVMQITNAQAEVLFKLRSTGAITVRDIAKQLGLSKFTVVEHLAQLRKRELVEYAYPKWSAVVDAPEVQVSYYQSAETAESARKNRQRTLYAYNRKRSDKVAEQDAEIERSWKTRQEVIPAGKWVLDHQLGARSVFELA